MIKKIFAGLCTLLFSFYDANGAADVVITTNKFVFKNCETNTNDCIVSAIATLGCTSGETATNAMTIWPEFVIICLPANSVPGGNNGFSHYCQCGPSEFSSVLPTKPLTWTRGAPGTIQCVKSTCTSCNACVSTASWVNVPSQVFQARTKKSCVGNNESWYATSVCVNSGSEYQCHNNYYGQSVNGASPTCTACPSVNDCDGTARTGTSTMGSNLNITSCVMSSTYNFCNTSGKYNFNADCNATP